MGPGHRHFCKDGVLDYQGCQIALIFGSLSLDFPANWHMPMRMSKPISPWSYVISWAFVGMCSLSLSLSLSFLCYQTSNIREREYIMTARERAVALKIVSLSSAHMQCNFTSFVRMCRLYGTFLPPMLPVTCTVSKLPVEIRKER